MSRPTRPTGTETTAIPAARSDLRRATTLDGFCTAASAADGVRLASLQRLDELEVRTRNSCYRLTLLDPHQGRVLVRGGAVFPVTSEVVVAGATAGGSVLRLGWIGCGFCLEFHTGHERIVTTPVQDVRRVGLGAQPASDEGATLRHS
jgi:hypothetical protein